MEHITRQHLQKYQDIINEINSTYERHELLQKQVEFETNKLSAIRITQQGNTVNAKVFQVLVKVFRSVFDIFYQYSDHLPREELERLKLNACCKFYVIELYTAKSFQTSIFTNNSFYHVAITGKEMCISKSVAVSDFQNTHFCVFVVPFNASSTNVTVTVSLLINCEQFYGALKIASYTTNISHHFSPYYEIPTSPLVQIANQYLPALNEIVKQNPKVEYIFQYQSDIKIVVETIIKNCYHLVKPHLLSTLTNESAATNLRLIVGNTPVDIKLNKISKQLTLVSEPKCLWKIKKYLFGEIQQCSLTLDKLWLLQLKNMKQHLRSEVSQPDISVENLFIIYNELQLLVSNLCI